MSKYAVAAPIKRIHNYKPAFFPGMTKVYAVVKHRTATIGSPCLLDTFFYSIPVRDIRDSSDVNCVLAFLSKENAEVYCAEMSCLHQNHNEPLASECKVDDFTISDLSFYAYNLRMRTAIVCNLYCEGTVRDPMYELMLTDQPIV